MLNSVIKRSFDMLMAIFALLVLWPLFLALALWIKFDSKGPVFFQQTRVGRYERNFKILKFRSMSVVLPGQTAGLLITVGQDARVTRSGAFIRKTKLDELPQLWCIIKGDMSIVGPRPALFNQDDLMQFRIATGVSKLKPGITGWAQINGRDEISIAKKVQLEQEYLYKKSLLFDIEIIIKTFTNVLFSKGVSH